MNISDTPNEIYTNSDLLLLRQNKGTIDSTDNQPTAFSQASHAKSHLKPFLLPAGSMMRCAAPYPHECHKGPSLVHVVMIKFELYIPRATHAVIPCYNIYRCKVICHILASVKMSFIWTNKKTRERANQVQCYS